MGAGTPWGEERHHLDYESEVENATMSGTDHYGESVFDQYLHPDTSLNSTRTGYAAAMTLAHNTTFDSGSQAAGTHTCAWMDANYPGAMRFWSDEYKARVGGSLNLTVNLLADVLHTIWVRGTDAASQVKVNELILNVPGFETPLLVAVVVVSAGILLIPRRRSRIQAHA